MHLITYHDFFWRFVFQFSVVNAARQLIDGQTAEPLNRMRVLVVGRERVGKTSTVRALLGQAFRKDEASTIGAHVTEGSASAQVCIHAAVSINCLCAFLN